MLQFIWKAVKLTGVILGIFLIVLVIIAMIFGEAVSYQIIALLETTIAWDTETKTFGLLTIIFGFLWCFVDDLTTYGVTFIAGWLNPLDPNCIYAYVSGSGVQPGWIVTPFTTFLEEIMVLLQMMIAAINEVTG